MSAPAISQAVARLRERIARAADAAERDPASITVVAASKLRSAEEIRAARAAGIEIFGENRVQEWLAKREACGDVRWHVIGALQRNKVRSVVGQVECLQAVPDQRVAEAVSRVAAARGARQSILLEVRTSPEPTKHGVEPQDAGRVARLVAALPGIRLDGFMTVADPSDPAASFRLLRSIRDAVLPDVPTAAGLSMGMSEDLEVAIAEGATIVRPGTALFGPRPTMP